MATDKLDQLFGVEEIKAQQAQVLGIIDDTVSRITEASKKMRINELFVSDSGGLSKSVEAIKAATAAINEQKAATDKLLAVKKQEQDLANAASNAGNAKIRKEDADAIQTITQAMAALSKEKERMAALALQETTNALKLSSSYEQIKKQYKDNADGAKQLAAAQVLAGNAINDYNDKTKIAIANTQLAGNNLNTMKECIAQYEAKIISCNEVGGQFNGLLSELPKVAGDSGDIIKELSEYIGSFASATIKARGEGRSWQGALTDIATSSEGITAAIKLTVEAMKLFSQEMSEAQRQYQVLSDAASINSQIVNITSASYIKTSEELDTMKRRFMDVNATIETKNGIVRELNERYGDTIGNINDINAAEDFFINRSDAFKEALFIRARIEGAYDALAENTQRMLKAQSITGTELLSNWQKTTAGIGAFWNGLTGGIGGGWVRMQQTYEQTTDRMTDVAKSALNGETTAANNSIRKFIDQLDQDLSSLNGKFNFSIPAKTTGNRTHISTSVIPDKPKNINLKKSGIESLPNRPSGNTADEDIEEGNKKTLAITQKFADEKQKAEDDYNTKKLEGQKTLADKEKELAKEVYNFVSNLIKASFDKKIAQINKTLDALNKSSGEEKDAADIKYQADKENIDKSITDNKEKEQALANAAKQREDRLAAIDANAEAQRYGLEQRKKQLQMDAARFEKAASIASIIAKTAEAVISALKIPVYGEALAAANAAIGAVQLATVIAQPVPAYFKGTPIGGHPGGPALIGDGGEPELVRGDGSDYWVNRPVVKSLARGAEVIPLHRLVADDRFEAGIKYIAGIPVLNNNNEGVIKELKAVAIAIRNQPIPGLYIDNGSIRKSMKRGNITQQYVNRNIVD